MSFARNFAAGQQIAQTAMDAFDQARLGKILSETKDAKAQDLAPVEDVQAVPVEQIQNQQPQIASADQPFLTPDSIGEATAAEPKRTQVGPKQYKFLDKTYDAPLTDEQTKAARADSLKTRMSELFNPVRGLKQVRELELQDQEDFKFGLFKTEAKRKQDDQAREDAADEAERSAFSKTSMGIAVADYARGIEEFNKAKAARDKAIQEGASPDSLPPMPAMPAMREISVADSLKDSINLQLARVQAGGKMNQEKLAQFVQAYQKANDEGYTRALTAANDGAPIERVADLFNKAGKVKFDPSNVVGDDWTTDQYGAKQRVISVYDPETKKTSKINVGAELASLGQAGAQLDKLYKLSQINANNATIDLRKAQTDLHGAKLGATNAQIDGTLPGAAGNGKGKGSADRSGMTQAEIAKADMLAYYEKATANDPNRTIGGAAKISDAIDQLAALNPAATSSELLNMATQMQTPEFVAEAAKSATVSLDPKTGSIVRTIPTAAGGSKRMAVGQLSFDQLDDAGREQLSSDVRKQAGELGINLPQLRAAARDPGQYKQLMAMVREQAKFRILEAARSIAAQSGQEVPMAQIEMNLKVGMQRIESMLGIARKLYANQ